MSNVYTVQFKDGKDIYLSNVLTRLRPFEISAKAEGFPKPGENDSGDKARERREDNYFIYSYTPSDSLHYLEYSYPVTQVNCFGTGEVPCTRGIYMGEGNFTGIVTKDQMKP